MEEGKRILREVKHCCANKSSGDWIWWHGEKYDDNDVDVGIRGRENIFLAAINVKLVSVAIFYYRWAFDVWWLWGSSILIIDIL
jgi:hypothetical protein